MVNPIVGIQQKKIFFPNLDGLRFFSFLLVFFSHTMGTDFAYIKNQWWYQFFKIRMFSDGDLGVSFFFVLSGFLISYLLIKENEFTGKIDVKSFYIRRILRIWPLYYLSVFIGFVIFPILKSYFGEVPNETADPFLCSLFLNNFNTIINGPPDSSILSVLWSVAIEEQFYLIWPILFFLVRPKYYYYLFLGVIIVSIAFRATCSYGIELHTLGVISDMAIGGLGAYLVIFNKRMLKYIIDMPFVLSLIPYTVAVIFIVFKTEIFASLPLVVTKRIIIAFFFCWIILDQNFSKRKFFKVSGLKIISKLGKYTYGLYCLHSIAVLIVITLLKKYELNTSSWQIWFLQLPLAMGLSIIFSLISYNFYEKKFLKLKDRFAYIVKK